MRESIKLILIFIGVSLVVLLIANVELHINKRKAIYEGELMKQYVYLPPRKTGLSDPIWVFNTKNVHTKDINFPPGFNKNKYLKIRIEEHIASKMNKPVLELLHSLQHLPKSSMPFNTLYKTISKGEEAVIKVDPISASPNESGYKVIHSKRDKIETFISGDHFYILSKN